MKKKLGKNINSIIDGKPISQRLYDMINNFRNPENHYLSEESFRGTCKYHQAGIQNQKAIFVTSKRNIDSGLFDIEKLKKFSINNNVKVLIPNYAEIENGNIKYLCQ